jgi:hypothetical protein
MKSNVNCCESGVCSGLGSMEASYRIPPGPGLPSLYKDMRNPETEIRFYYIHSVEWKDKEDGLYQTGCGLNLKGKYATLCTCKLEVLRIIHKRQGRLDKEPVYLAVLGDTKGRRENSQITPLVFLGKVEESFDSFQQIWEYLPKRARYAKDVSRHVLGDLYPPKLVRRYRQTGRIKFPKGHAHANGSYKKDLDKSHPIVFKEWKTWSGAKVGFGRGDGRSVASKQAKEKFRRMIKAPRQSRYGWLYSLSDLRSVMRGVFRPKVGVEDGRAGF